MPFKIEKLLEEPKRQYVSKRPGNLNPGRKPENLAKRLGNLSGHGHELELSNGRFLCYIGNAAITGMMSLGARPNCSSMFILTHEEDDGQATCQCYSLDRCQRLGVVQLEVVHI